MRALNSHQGCSGPIGAYSLQENADLTPIGRTQRYPGMDGIGIRSVSRQECRDSRATRGRRMRLNETIVEHAALERFGAGSAQSAERSTLLESSSAHLPDATNIKAKQGDHDACLMHEQLDAPLIDSLARLTPAFRIEPEKLAGARETKSGRDYCRTHAGGRPPDGLDHPARRRSHQLRRRRNAEHRRAELLARRHASLDDSEGFRLALSARPPRDQPQAHRRRHCQYFLRPASRRHAAAFLPRPVGYPRHRRHASRH